MPKNFKLNNTLIGNNQPTYIIGELSGNHGGDLNTALKLVEEAKKMNVNAVKLQTYTAETITLNSNKEDFILPSGNAWEDSETLFKLYSEAYTPWEWHKPLFDKARDLEIDIFSSPFDESAVDLLESLNAPAYKIASFELIDLPLIERAAKCKKPLLMSTGMADLKEIAQALEVAKMHGCGDVLLFHCISSYPTPIHESNLTNILKLKSEFDVEIGLSDHTTSNLAATVAIGLGVTAIEKHFKPADDSISPDASFSITSQQLASLVSTCNDAWESIGTDSFNRSVMEEYSRKYRRSIYFIRDLKAGERISETDIKCIRPGFGLPPKYFKEIIGSKIIHDVERGDPVTFEDIKVK